MFRDIHGGAETVPNKAEVRETIARMESLMTSDQRYNHAGVPAQVALDLIRSGALDSFRDFENTLREMGSKVHFIGVPLDFYGPDWADKTVSPIDSSIMPDYTLWTGVNGSDEASVMLVQLGITPEENSQRLLSTGILSVS